MQFFKIFFFSFFLTFYLLPKSVYPVILYHYRFTHCSLNPRSSISICLSFIFPITIDDLIERRCYIKALFGCMNFYPPINFADFS